MKWFRDVMAPFFTRDSHLTEVMNAVSPGTAGRRLLSVGVLCGVFGMIGLGATGCSALASGALGSAVLGAVLLLLVGGLATTQTGCENSPCFTPTPTPTSCFTPTPTSSPTPCFTPTPTASQMSTAALPFIPAERLLSCTDDPAHASKAFATPEEVAAAQSSSTPASYEQVRTEAIRRVLNNGQLPDDVVKHLKSRSG